MVQGVGDQRRGLRRGREGYRARLPAGAQVSLAGAKTLVVKVGSSLVTNEGRGVDAAAIARWAGEVAQLHKTGRSLLLVSSGAIVEGMHRLGWAKRPHSMHELQAAAAVGQMGLVQCYESCFREHGLRTAQVLLTHADMADRQRYLNARSTLRTLLRLGVIPVINENDTVVTDEIKLGDNDTLGALVTNLVEADALVILTDQAGLYDADPRRNPQAKFIESIEANHPELESMAGGVGSALAKGGMLTKVLAAKRAARSGAQTVIASGREPDVLVRLARGEAVGTLFTTRTVPLAARKQWLADHVTVTGQVKLDAGAVKALSRDGKSLLPIGVVEVTGDFERGAVVGVLDAEGREVARGLINYSSEESRRIMRRPSSEIESVLGYVDEPELIHRDNLVLL
jgi:glutamate 5-kinase